MSCIQLPRIVAYFFFFFLRGDARRDTYPFTVPALRIRPHRLLALQLVRKCGSAKGNRLVVNIKQRNGGVKTSARRNFVYGAGFRDNRFVLVTHSKA